MSETINLATVKQYKTITDRIYHQLKDDIVKGVLVQGQKIGEANLAKKYNTSRGPLREALQRLEGVYLVDRIPNAGFSVVRMGYQKARELYQVRELLEGYAARLATEAMSESDVEDLRHLIAEHKEMVNRSGGVTYIQKEGNRDFHFYIYSRCGNNWLINCITNNIYYLMRVCRLSLSFRTASRATVALKEHNAIVEAIVDRDADLVELLVRRHIRASWKTLEEKFDAGLI